MAYLDNTQDRTQNGKKLSPRTKVDSASPVAWWPAANATGSGADELAENFNAPFYGESKGTK